MAEMPCASVHWREQSLRETQQGRAANGRVKGV